MKRPASDVDASGAGLDATLDHLGLHPMTDDKAELDNLEIHPLALAFPVYGKQDFEKLTNDIRNHGLRQPIALFEGKVLDGRNRVEAARKAGLTHVPSKKFEGTFDEARDYVISLNLVRRHLDTGQRAMIAAELATMPHGVIGASRKIAACPPKQPPSS
jgi:hypothetical protein